MGREGAVPVPTITYLAPPGSQDKPSWEQRAVASKAAPVLPQLAFPITLPGPTQLLRLQSWVRTELYRGTRLPPLPSQQKAQSFQHVVGWGIKAALHLAQPRNQESLGILQGCSMEELQAAGGKLRPSHRSSISSPAHTVPQLLPFAPSHHSIQMAIRLLRCAMWGEGGLHFACGKEQ